MEDREQYKRLIMFVASAALIILQVLIFYQIWERYYNFRSVIGTLYWRRGNWALLGVYAFISFFFSKIFGAYKVGYLKVSEVLISQLLAVLCCNAVTYLQLALIGRWRFSAYIQPILSMTLYDLLVVFFWVVFMRWIYSIIYPPKRMLLVHGAISPKFFIKKLESRKDKYVIVDRIDLSEGMDKVYERMLDFESVVIGDIPSQDRNQLLKYCFENKIRCYTIPKISDIMIKSSSTINLFDTELLLFRNRGLTIEQRFFKRIMDIVVSLIILIIFAIPLVIIAIAVKLTDGGPILYTQERLTQDGKTFKILKFRSMRVDAEKQGAQLAKKDDDRITKVGKIIRRLHVDELPQLFNILKGEMSFVGPRPERPDIAEQYKESIPEFDFRLRMKAGLTGYAQVFGNYSTTPLDKLKLDLTYIENYNFFLDFLIIIQTVKILAQKENSQGIESGTTALRTEEKNK